MSTRCPLRACLDLARAGNFPSVVSNVLRHARPLVHRRGSFFPPFATFALAALAGCLLYAGGATFNDVFDAGFDARHRPERAIPRGVISRPAAAWLAAAEMAAGVALLLFRLHVSLAWTLALVATILAYDWIHKRWLGSVVLMAGCRVLLAVALASSPFYSFTPALLGWVAALFVYIVTLSLLARREYRPGAPAAKIGRSVGRLLAFIPLLDALALLLVGAWLPALACAAAIPLGRFAQRLAAST